MASDDEDELAQLRSQRNARLGIQPVSCNAAPEMRTPDETAGK